MIPNLLHLILDLLWPVRGLERIGGDLFAIVWDAKTQKLYGLNASGRTARGTSTAEMKAHLATQGLDALPFYGPLSVSVPGAVSGWAALHERFGTVPLNEILAPAIDYAENGHPVAELIAFYWQRSAPHLAAYPGFSDTFTVEAGYPNVYAPGKRPFHTIIPAFKDVGTDRMDTSASV